MRSGPSIPSGVRRALPIMSTPNSPTIDTILLGALYIVEQVERPGSRRSPQMQALIDARFAVPSLRGYAITDAGRAHLATLRSTAIASQTTVAPTDDELDARADEAVAARDAAGKRLLALRSLEQHLAALSDATNDTRPPLVSEDRVALDGLRPRAALVAIRVSIAFLWGTTIPELETRVADAERAVNAERKAALHYSAPAANKTACGLPLSQEVEWTPTPDVARAALHRCPTCVSTLPL